MKQLIDHINQRNKILPTDLITIQSELESIFKKNILRAGVGRPGYFSDFIPILENNKHNNVITNYHISEEEHTQDGNLYKIPMIDVTYKNTGSNYRIFLSPL